MEKRNYKNTNEQISLLGFGCMRLPLRGKGAGDIDEAQAQEMVDTAIAGGVNYFDTAYLYHEGQSESFIGKALSGHLRESFNLATKMPPWFLNEQGDIERIFEEQLRSCRVDYFDYYLLHSISDKTLPVFEKFGAYEFLREKQKEGKLRRLGFSFHDKVPFLKQVVDKYEWDFAQIQLNYLDWEQQDAKGQYDILTEKGIPVIVMEPLRGGVLAKLCEPCAQIMKKANPDAAPSSWALRFAATLPNVMTVLSGMGDVRQVKDNIAVMTPFAPLKEADYQTIEQVVGVYRLNATIPCTACGYCMDCPYGVDIPHVFDVYNHFQNSKRELDFMIFYPAINKEARAHNCVSCGSCTERCPQNIVIPGWMSKVDAAYRQMKE